MQGEAKQAILTAKDLQICQKSCTYIALIVTLSVLAFVWLASTLFGLELSLSCDHVISFKTTCHEHAEDSNTCITCEYSG